MRKYFFVVAICVGALMHSRAARSEDVNAAEKKRPPVNVGGVDAKDGGTVTGIVKFNGAKPESKPIAEIAGNAFCKECYPDELPRHDEFVFGKNGADDTLQNVLVYVSKGLEGKRFDVPREPVVLDQVGCMYTPHVVAVMAGQTLQVRNSDSTLHNVMCNPRDNPPFNIGMPANAPPMEKVFRHPELKMNFRCFMHPWMSAYVHVLEHPFFAVTQSDGSFTLKGLPPGEYQISVLHESSLLEPVSAMNTVKVGAGETKKTEFTYQTKSQAK